MQKTKGPLAGIRVLDLSRILAGPSATQILGDLGADVIKVEKPGAGDDTRAWGPPYVTQPDGTPGSESAYYLSCNRNKRSITVDFTTAEGLALLKKLLATSDILVENYKTGTLDRHGLSYDQLKGEFPRLIYASLTGFGHTGPERGRAGYDFMVQGMGGIMSLTGPAEGPPFKTGVAIADLMAGMYMLTGILAALYSRTISGRGQFIDTALLDTQVAWLSNAGQYYLTSGHIPPRMGNAHPTIVPYEVFETSDSHVVLAVGNDRQFADFCAVAGRPELATDTAYAKNRDRVVNRERLLPVIRALMHQHTAAWWLRALDERGVPCGPVNTLEQVFSHPQVKARAMTVDLPHPQSKDPVTLIASPLRLSDTPVAYERAPPTLGQHTDEILSGLLGLSGEDIKTLREKKAI